MEIILAGDKMVQYYANKIQYVNVNEPIILLGDNDIDNSQYKNQKNRWIKVNNILYQCSECGAVQLKSEKCKYCKTNMEMDI